MERTVLQIRCTPEEKRRVLRDAKRSGCSLSDYIRMSLELQVTGILRKKAKS